MRRFLIWLLGKFPPRADDRGLIVMVDRHGQAWVPLDRNSSHNRPERTSP